MAGKNNGEEGDKEQSILLVACIYLSQQNCFRNKLRLCLLSKVQNRTGVLLDQVTCGGRTLVRENNEGELIFGDRVGVTML